MRDDSVSSWSENRLLRLIFEHASDAVVVIDDDGRLVMANRAAREMPGIDVERFFVWTPRRDPELTSLRAQLRVGGRGAAEIRLADGENGARVLGLEGRAHGPYYVVVLRDVTERRMLEDEVHRLRRLQDVGELTATVVHDFNNVLTAILFASSLLAKDVADQERPAQLTREIREGAERVAGLVRRMLGFLRRPPSKAERVNVGTAVMEMRAMLELVVGAGIALSVDVDPGVADAVVERDELDRVLVALARSSREAMPQGGRLTIAAANVSPGDHEATAAQCATATSYVSVTMTDTGQGMPADVRERVFARIDSGPGAPRDAALGLAAAYRFAKRSGGCIAVHSAPGQGTTVAIYLPTEPATAVPRSGEGGDSPPPPPGGSETILVVDPDEPVRGAVGAVLRELGYSVLDAPSGDLALKQAERAGSRVGLVLAELRTPGLHGGAVLERLREAGHSPRLLWMSGDSDRAIASQDLVGQPLLRKAFSPHQLARRVREVLDR